MISLYFIEGINEINTPLFKDINSQNLFFENHLISEIYNSYYPPHLKNVIRIDKDKITLLSQINYLSLYYNNKYYYYFIEDVKYVNSDILDIYIKMDTIQTYLFDIVFNNASIDRMNIIRYNDDYSINREYIRENYSRNENEMVKFENEISDFPILVIVSTSQLYLDNDYQDTFANKFYIKNNFDNKRYTDNIYVYYMPFIYDIIKILNESVIGNYEYYCLPNNILRLMVEDAETTSVYITNSKKVQDYLGLYYDEQNDRYVSTTSKVVNYGGKSTSGSQNHLFNVGIIDIDILNTFTKIEIDDFKVSNILENPINYKFVPQLIDSNYYLLQYGEVVGLTTFPLEYLTKNELYKCNFNDITKNYRTYILQTDNNSINDKFMTCICNTSQQNLTIYNNAWQQYKSLNSATLSTGKSLAIANTLYNGLSTSKSNIGIMNTFVNSGFQALDYYVNEENIKNTPNTVKNGNNGINDIISNTCVPITSIYRSKDIKDVAYTLEWYGFKVLEEVNYNPIFYNNRYYFNYLKLKDCTIYLKDLLNDNNTINDIKNRLKIGVRLFNMDNQYVELGKYKCDNVENKYITGGVKYE